MKTILLIISLSMFTHAVYPQWTWRNPLPQGNDLNVIRVLDDQSVWACGSIGTVMHSVNGGLTWDIRNLADHSKYTTFTGLDFPGGSSGFVVDRYGYIFRTADDGNTWDSIYYENDEYLNASCFTDSVNGHVVCSHGKILRTIDGGSTWSSLYVSPAVNFNCVSFPSGQTGYAGGFGNILKTTDGGGTWNVILNDSTRDIAGMGFSSPTTGFVFGGHGLVMKTTDGGGTWDTQHLGDTIVFTSVGIFNPDTILLNAWALSATYMISYTMKFRSTDGGITWTRLVLPDDMINTSAISCGPGGLAWLAGGYGILQKTEDYGSTWTLMNNLINSPLSAGFSITGIDFPSAQTGYAISGGWESETGITMKTTDGGDTWFRLDTTWRGVAHPCVDFMTDDIGCICSNDIYSTFDGGLTWILRYTGSWDTRIWSVSFGSGATGVAVGDNGVFLRSTDLGQSWSHVAGVPIIDYKAVHFADANTAYAAGTSTILKSTDAGATWTTVSTFFKLQALWFTSPDTGFGVGGDGLIIRTTDGGVSWDVMNSTTTEDLLSVHFYDADTGYVAGGTDVVRAIVLKTTDGGTTWHEQFVPSYYPLYCIRTTGSKAYTGGWDCFLFGTTNGGVGVSTGPEARRHFINTSAFPNPSAGEVTIRYELSGISSVEIMFSDAYGRQIQSPVTLRQGSGKHTYPFPSDGLQPGVYFYTLRINGQSETKKVIIY